MPEELSEEDLAQREFFVGLQKSEILKRIFQPDFDEAARELCLQCTGQMCNSLFLPYAGLNTDTDIDTFMQDLMNAFPGMRKLERKGDVIHYDFYLEVKGECPCPMIALGHLEPTPLWCRCGNYFNKAMFEAVVKHPVQVELLDSPLTTGSDFCRRLIHLKPPASTTRVMSENSEKAPEQTSVDARSAIDRMLSLKRKIEIKEDKTVRELMDELQLSSAALLEVNGEIFYPDRIKDRRLRRGDKVILLPWIVGG